MKKLVAMLLSLILCLGLLTGCGAKNYAVEESTLFVLKDGKVISTDVEDFDSSYDEGALEAYVNNVINEYNAEHGEDSVKLNELKVEEGKAILVIEYASAGDYTAFTGIELYVGNVLDALAAGYSFDGDFASIEDGEAKACSNQDIMDESKLNVVIYKGLGNVNVNGKILFASVENTKYVDKDTIAISTSYNLLGLAIQETSENDEIGNYDADFDEEFDESFEEDFSEEDFSEEEFSEDNLDGAIGDEELSFGEDDLLANSPEEDVEDDVEFDFDGIDDYEDGAEEVVTYTNVYTYIIYK